MIEEIGEGPPAKGPQNLHRVLGLHEWMVDSSIARQAVLEMRRAKGRIAAARQMLRAHESFCARLVALELLLGDLEVDVLAGDWNRNALWGSPRKTPKRSRRVNQASPAQPGVRRPCLGCGRSCRARHGYCSDCAGVGRKRID